MNCGCGFTRYNDVFAAVRVKYVIKTQLMTYSHKITFNKINYFLVSLAYFRAPWLISVAAGVQTGSPGDSLP